jgi:hypothetical protein
VSDDDIYSPVEPDDSTNEDWTAPPPAPWSRRKKSASVGVVLILLAGGLVGGALVQTGRFGTPSPGPAYGGQCVGLPADFCAKMSKRLEDIAPPDAKSLSSEEKAAWLDAQRRDGLPRLDDATLIRRYRLKAAGVAGMPIADCATFWGGTSNPRGGSRSAILDALSDEQRADWIEIEIEGIEAGVRGVPDVMIPTADAAHDAIQTFDGLATPEEARARAAWDDSAMPSDAVACAGVRALFAVVLRFSAADLATVARYNVRP